MHDRKRQIFNSKEEQEEVEKKTKLKIDKYRELKTRVLEGYAEHNFNHKLLDGDLKTILMINPEFYSAWNYRKEILERNDNNQEDLQKELSLTEESLRSGKGLKSYSVWWHREICVRKMSSSQWIKELQLCNSLLNADERNCIILLLFFIIFAKYYSYMEIYLYNSSLLEL